MEFSLFAHMERIDEGQSQKRLYVEFVELCQIADRSGFKTIWNGEHHGMNFTIAPNPFVNLTPFAESPPCPLPLTSVIINVRSPK